MKCQMKIVSKMIKHLGIILWKKKEINKQTTEKCLFLFTSDEHDFFSKPSSFFFCSFSFKLEFSHSVKLLKKSGASNIITI